MIERVSPAGVPSPRGPYSPAVKAGGFIYVSGQISVDPATDKAHLGDVATETRQVLKNIETNLAACGATMADVVRCTVYLTNVADFAAMNAVYSAYFEQEAAPLPARTTVEVSRLPKDVLVEIDMVAEV